MLEEWRKEAILNAFKRYMEKLKQIKEDLKKASYMELIEAGVLPVNITGKDVGQASIAMPTMPKAIKPKELPISQDKLSIEEILSQFKRFLKIDLGLSKSTVYAHAYKIKRFLLSINKPIEAITTEDIRNWLESLANYSANHRKNTIKALRRFFRDYLHKPWLIENFKLPYTSFKPIKVPSDEEVKKFYNALESLRDKALFLLFATSGLRSSEVLGLSIDDIDLENRIIKPKPKDGRTKHVWISFFNEEAKKALEDWLKIKPNTSKKLFPMRTNTKHSLWKKTREKTGIDITPKALRAWFCSKMARLGISEAYIDAFCGRIPRTVLARHYIDYSQERLKEIYDKANLKVLS
jgi:integrase